ncbi:PfkB family carbohydrate kinase [Haliangium ochraceum]|uniref:PfkB domain protein n=1 Tax=Haliangium ochraceum (strain DSM 14365 / JCM 11303 / SMP-2) TaxID=502025 RepID=D0LNX4_HALO1|nr:PfkB family carbohydrate kinase [Haliangium ochraceum]ACY18800.1 PfkB domain protein [Haliangium ochraceum DSM 14365]
MITRSANHSLLVVGSVALDDIDGPYGKQPDLLGGSASYLCTAASYFTQHVSCIAVVGDDFPQQHLDDLAARGVDISGVERAEGKTFRWVGKYADDLVTRETLDTQLGVFADFKPKLQDSHRGAQLVCLGNIDPELQAEVLEQCPAAKLVAADTMNFWISGKRDALLRTLARVHTLLLNDEEARQLAGEHNLIRAAAGILRMGPHSVVIKRGDAGALLVYKDGIFAAPAMPLEDVRDPTGAGDSFAGGFMGYLAYAGDLSPENIRTAMITGSVMASFSVEQFSLDGLRGLTQERIQQRFDAFSDLTRFESLTL